MSLAALSEHDLALLRTVPLFSELSDAVRAELLRGLSVHRYPDDTLLFAAGDPARRFFVVLEGAVRLLVVTSAGDETIIDVVGAGNSFAEAAIFASGRYPVQAEALAGTRLVAFDGDAFLARLKSDPRLGLQLLGSLGRWQLRLTAELRQLKLQTPAQRLAWFLVALTDRVTGPARVHLPYRKTLVASRIGITPESLSRGLARLAGIGVHSRGNAVEIDDVAALRRFCDG
jgi:CRP-like cAMP-binding protein